MKNNIFRKTSLERISSPEQLNEYIKIVNPGVFGILIGLIAIIASVGLWSMFGSISDTVQVKGMVFPQNGIVNVISSVEGRISDVRVKEGDFVNTGQIISIVPQDNLIKQINEMKLNGDSNSKQINSLVSQYENTSIISSPVSGMVINVMKMGDSVSTDKPVAKIIKQEKYANDKQVICYVSASTAKKLSMGMDVQVSPDFASREEYGYMYGRITSIGEYPVTSDEVDSAMGGLENKSNLLPGGSAIEVKINLTMDPNSSDLIKWSNKKGENTQIGIGTNCNILIVLNKQHPIKLIFSGSQED
ncbi:biotin/lipoyl-binding protein [Clostridium sp. AWRP]|uniref:biotin/lipoyl-binding protein n=1 Tax=Clostridium sp. AWRP TaxID=2212991 RepID=UPI000FD858CE|nr:biotin/lipoyl-binding protein [Clostridium sp. AWRP]AZV56590.1 biotin/lipoyl-binding protein [Clostridium sp. AWRP]